MKKWNLFRGAGICMLLGSMMATTVSAQMMQGGPPAAGGNPHQGGERGRMERPPMGHPSPGGMQGANFFSLQGLKETLGLNDDQAKKLHDLFVDYKKGTIQRQAALQISQIELEEMIAEPKLDLAKIEKKAKDKEAQETDLMMFRIRSMAKAKDFLSDAQFDRFRQMIEMRMMSGMRGGMHGGMSGMMGGSHGSMGMSPHGKGGMGMEKGMMGSGSPHSSGGSSYGDESDDE
ncbi:MAG: periplasmic heavy metal sensor [Nitrospirae bacterium]|nr:periplasmic heavy metal sensor [Candidatus Manganitrophaceae bacterium]